MNSVDRRMRKISANLIIPVSSPPLPNGIVLLDEKGKVLEVKDTGGRLREEAGLEFYSGVILPGFVLPWVRLPEMPESLAGLDRALMRNGIRGAGVILAESGLNREGLELMRASAVSYHPIIELDALPGEEDFEVFNRGVELLSRAWNEFSLSGTLVPGRNLDDLSELKRYIREYNAVHEHMRVPGYDTGIPGAALTERASTSRSGNVKDAASLKGEDDPDILPGKPLEYPPENSLNILKKMQTSRPDADLLRVLRCYTLEAAGRIFEKDVLGSLEQGKSPGLNLVSGIETGNLRMTGKTSLRILV